MNICVINGSPKGSYSVTLQTVLYLEKLFPKYVLTYNPTIGMMVWSSKEGFIA